MVQYPSNQKYKHTSEKPFCLCASIPNPSNSFLISINFSSVSPIISRLGGFYICVAVIALQRVGCDIYKLSFLSYFRVSKKINWQIFGFFAITHVRRGCHLQEWGTSACTVSSNSLHCTLLSFRYLWPDFFPQVSSFLTQINGRVVGRFSVWHEVKTQFLQIINKILMANIF